MKSEKWILVSIIGAITLVVIFFGLEFQEQQKQNMMSQISSLETITEEPENFPQDKIFVYSLNGNGNIDIYIKGSAEESNKYIGFQLHRFKSELNREVGASNYDLYKIESANEYRRVLGDRFFFENNVVRKGEWEMAIKEQGANDFIGGTAHGDEVMKTIKVYVDGEEVEPTESIKQEADEFELVTTSDIYRDNTITENLEVIGIHEKTYIFNKDGVTLDQKVTFNQDLMLDKSYLTMFPILRKDDSGRQVTDVALIPDNEIEQDVSEEGFQIIEVEANKVVISGKDSGVEATVEILEKGTNYPTSIFVSESALYNKVYFSYVQNDYQVDKDEVWTQKSHFMIDTKN